MRGDISGVEENVKTENTIKANLKLILKYGVTINPHWRNKQKEN